MKKLMMIMTASVASALAGCSANPSLLDTCGEERLCVQNEEIEVDMTGVPLTASAPGSVSTQGLLDPILSLTPVLTLVGTLNPPTIGTQQLQASDITVSGSKVYVGYNVAGETQAGGIDMIDISVPGVPVLKSQALYATADIHKVAIDGTNLYAVGATSGVNEGAMLYKIGLDSAGALTSTVTEKSLHRAADSSPAYAGVSVATTSSYVYAASGTNGGLHILNKSDLSEQAFTAVERARGLSIGSFGEVFMVTGKTLSEDAKIKRFDPSTGAFMSTTNISVPNAQIDDAKSTLYTGGLAHVVTAGFGGARLMCNSTTGSTIGTMTNPALTGLTPELQTANAATFGNGLIYVANGEAGVTIYSVEKALITVGCTGYSVVYRGRFTFGAGISANNVFWSNGNLVVATGKGGFKIIKVTQSLLAGLLQIL